MTIHVVTDTYAQAVQYGKDQGFTLAAIKHITQAHQLAGLHRAELHILPEAEKLGNLPALLRAAKAKQATLVYAEEA